MMDGLTFVALGSALLVVGGLMVAFMFDDHKSKRTYVIRAHDPLDPHIRATILAAGVATSSPNVALSLIAASPIIR